MSESTTLTIRLPQSVKDKLDQLAIDTDRSKSYLAAEAVEHYVDRELAIVASIKRGLEDMEAGRTVPHEQVMAEVREIIEAAKRKHA
ncbi:ribbon-helix-helix protein, CopG family [Oleomonas cavernae]|uniref:Ribbon-helix-helix protein, CopG family n=1 Tax=Oleomonas cavernae TaxID=2320859 RepID=A0A418W9A0_9PROT|nr:CopG family ribbon-helix-helix protein [Oleomonas cavernae]RJF86595.1 ribbon-helix-helix protein, CopG family [Oleomonas cavernae]